MSSESDVIDLLGKIDYQGDFDEIMRLGEIPWKLNLSAVKTLDIELDGKKGRKEVEKLIKGINTLLPLLKGMRKDAIEVKRAASAALRG